MANEPKPEWGPWEKSSSSEILSDLTDLQKKFVEEASGPPLVYAPTALERIASAEKLLDEKLGPRCGEIATHFTSHYGPRCELHRVYPSGAANDRPHMLQPEDKCQCRLGKGPVVMQGRGFLEKCRAQGLKGLIQASIVVDDPRDIELTAEQSAALTDWWKKTTVPRIAWAVGKTAAQGCVPTSVILPEEHLDFIKPKKAIFEDITKAWQKTYEELWDNVPCTPPEPDLPKEVPHTYKIASWADSHPGERMPVAHVLHAAEELPIGRRPCYYCGRARLAVRFTDNNVPVCGRHERTS